MTGTLLNIVTVVLGGLIGIFFGARFPTRMRETIIAGLGLFTASYGIMIFLDTQNPLIPLGAVLMGGILGEWLKIETRLERIGSWLEKRFNVSSSNRNRDIENSNKFIRGFLTASLVFCVGPMTILGSIQDGLSGDYQLLAVKSILDGFAALAFASTLGPGVLFSTLVILVYQGGITLLAAQVSSWVTDSMIAEMTAVGGILLIGLAISSLLEIKKIRAGNFLPALIVAPLIVAIVALF